MHGLGLGRTISLWLLHFSLSFFLHICITQTSHSRFALHRFLFQAAFSLGLTASCALFRTFLHRLCCILCSSFCFRAPCLHSVAHMAFICVRRVCCPYDSHRIYMRRRARLQKKSLCTGLCYLLPEHPSDAVLDDACEDLTAEAADTPAC